MHYRVFRLKVSTNAELTSVDKLYELEFSDASDIEPSVYAIADADRVRAHIQHIAAAGMSPPKESRCGIDIAPLGWPTEAQDPKSPFAFINQAHRLTKTVDETARRALAAGVHALVVKGMSMSVKKPALRDHVRSRVSEQDQEWARFLSVANNGWREFAGLLPTS